MQVQIKKQLKIELDQQDIISAVGTYLSSNGINVNPDELAEINFVKSPKDGLRASLNITEETGVAADEETTAVPTEVAPAAPAVEAVPETTTAEPEPETEEDSEPGIIAASTVEDVMPSIDEAAQLASTVAEEEPAADPRKSLFK